MNGILSKNTKTWTDPFNPCPPASARSLAPGAELKPLNSFEVLKPFEVDAGRAAPWFNQPGGGLQFDLGTRTVQDLVDAQILRPLQ